MDALPTGALETWHDVNQRHLAAAVTSVVALLRHHLGQEPGEEPTAGQVASPLQQELSAPPALDRLVAIFELSPFERDLLVLCAGVELDAELARLCAALHPADRCDPTFGLALAALPGAHWSALNPAAPLRRWRLVELEGGSSREGLLTTSPLRIDERILHYLTGIQYLDERLAGIIAPLAPSLLEENLVPSHEDLVERASTGLRQAAGIEQRQEDQWQEDQRRHRPWPIVQLTGAESVAKTRIAAAIAADLGMNLAVLAGSAVPTTPAELDGLQRLWEREAALTGSALLVDLEDGDDLQTGSLERNSSGAIGRLVETLQGVVFIASREPRRIGRRPILAFEVPRPSSQEQSQLWREALEDTFLEDTFLESTALEGHSLNGHLDDHLKDLGKQFNLDSSSLADAARRALVATHGEPVETLGPTLKQALWQAARDQCRPKVSHLAQRIDSAATWNDLVLPADQKAILQNVVSQVRHRSTVHGDWGFGAKGPRGLGITALFAGVSGTGKTLAAEVVANALQLDLYRIDLASVISKYIGETEKNLSRVFDAGEQGGAVLLFDEADALFGKRSEVKDSHDRYANVEISYLLQRMEAYRGLAILTTNMKSALDNAFLRRLRFVVEFPFPDADQRAEIWRRIFPPQTPTEALDPAKLARLNVAGGTIRNIALGGAFTAAEEGSPVGMAHLLRAARSEYRKLEKPLNETETRGWVASGRSYEGDPS